MIGQGRYQSIPGYEDAIQKLLLSFGLVSFIIDHGQRRCVHPAPAQCPVANRMWIFTVPLAEFAQMGTALTKHHQILLDVASATKQSDFAGNHQASSLKAEIEKAINKSIKSTNLRCLDRAATKWGPPVRPASQNIFQEADGSAQCHGRQFRAIRCPGTG